MLHLEKYHTNRVCTEPGKPGKVWNFAFCFSRPGKAWNSHGDPWKTWKSLEKYFVLHKEIFFVFSRDQHYFISCLTNLLTLDLPKIEKKYNQNFERVQIYKIISKNSS